MHRPCCPTGMDFVVPVMGYICRICHKFYHSNSGAQLSHCKSLAHFEKLQVSEASCPGTQTPSKLMGMASGPLAPSWASAPEHTPQQEALPLKGIRARMEPGSFCYCSWGYWGLAVSS